MVAAKATNQTITTYSPIAYALLMMDKTLKERMKKKFDTFYVMAKEGISFQKYPSLHGVILAFLIWGLLM